MLLAVTCDPFQDTDLLFAQQMGVHAILARAERWDVATLEALHNRVTQAGLALAGIESLPSSMYARAIVGQTGRDQEIAQVRDAIANLGQAGIPMVGYRWQVPQAYVLQQRASRGGALVQIRTPAHPLPQEVASLTAEQMWQNLTYFARQVIPAAEDAGVKLACQPNVFSPPPSDGFALLTTLESVMHLFDVAPSAAHGLDLDLGKAGLFPGVALGEAIRSLGQAHRIFSVCVRHLRSAGDSVEDAFLDEDGSGLFWALWACEQVGYEGTVRPAPPPAMVGDTPWGHKGHAYNLGYLHALLQALG